MMMRKFIALSVALCSIVVVLPSTGTVHANSLRGTRWYGNAVPAWIAVELNTGGSSVRAAGYAWDQSGGTNYNVDVRNIYLRERRWSGSYYYYANLLYSGDYGWHSYSDRAQTGWMGTPNSATLDAKATRAWSLGGSGSQTMYSQDVGFG